MKCLPLELLTNVYIPLGDFLSDLEYYFKRFVSNNVYKTLQEEHPVELEAILKTETAGTDDFDALMQIYESDPNAFVDSFSIKKSFERAV